MYPRIAPTRKRAATMLLRPITHAGKRPADNPIEAMNQGNDRERAACHPDVTRFCQTQLQVNPNDTLGILGCLQANRPKISRARHQVLASHGQ